jgi:hypothetical protein
MTKTPSNSTTNSAPSSTAIEAEDDDDLFEGGDYAILPETLEEETIKRDARRKIEIYWEKKRLREQFEDFDESEFGF